MLNEFKEEKNIEADFFRLLRLAQMDEPAGASPSLNQTEDALDLGEGGNDGLDLDETLDPGEPGGGEDALPDIDTDSAEMEAVKELIPWDSFVILFDPHYAKTLQDALQLPEPKAKSKSFYIYFSPENKRVEGILNKRLVGGYNQKEVLGEDFAFLKSLSPEGFPEDWKDKILSDIDELPAVENSKIKDELRRKQEEKEKTEEEKVDEEPLEPPAPEAPAEEEGAPKSKAPTQEVPPPPSVGKVDTKGLASITDFQMRKFARMNKMSKMSDEEKQAYELTTKKIDNNTYCHAPGCKRKKDHLDQWGYAGDPSTGDVYCMDHGNQLKTKKRASRIEAMNKIASNDSNDRWIDYLSDLLGESVEEFEKEISSQTNKKILNGIKAAFEYEVSHYQDTEKIKTVKDKIKIIENKIKGI